MVMCDPALTLVLAFILSGLSIRDETGFDVGFDVHDVLCGFVVVGCSEVLTSPYYVVSTV